MTESPCGEAGSWHVGCVHFRLINFHSCFLLLPPGGPEIPISPLDGLVNRIPACTSAPWGGGGSPWALREKDGGRAQPSQCLHCQAECWVIAKPGKAAVTRCVPSAPCALLSLHHLRPVTSVPLFTPIVQMGKPKHTEGKPLALGDTAWEWQR